MNILSLPADLLVTHVLPQLELHELARLDEAWPQDGRMELYTQCFSRLHPRPQHDVLGEPFRAEWMHKRYIRIHGMNLGHLSKEQIPLVRAFSSIFQSFTVALNKADTEQLIMDAATDAAIRNRIKTVSMMLPRLDTNCNTWRQFCLFNNLEHLTFTIHDAATAAATAIQVQHLLTACPHLHSLTYQCKLHAAQGPDFIGTILNCPSAKQLTRLTLREINISDEDLIQIGLSCTELEHFHLQCKQTKVVAVTESGMLILAGSLHKLRKLIVYLPTIMHDVLSVFLDHNPCLHTVAIYGSIVDNATLHAASKGTDLREWTITNWAATSSNAVMNARSFFGKLEILCLHLKDYTDLEATALHDAVAHCTGLAELHVLDLQYSNRGVLHAIAAHCRGLRRFHVHGDFNQSVRNYSPLLTELARNNREVSELLLRRIELTTTELMEIIKHLPRLTRICLHETVVDHTDDLVKCLIANCPQYSFASFCFGPSITDQAVLALAQAPAGNLDLSQCTLVTEAAVTQLVQRNRKLVVLFVPCTLPQEARDRILAAGRAVRKPSAKLNIRARVNS